MKGNGHKIGAGAVLVPLSGALINLIFFVVMEKLSGSLDVLLPFRFGYALFPVLLVTDALFLAFSVLESRKDGQKSGGGCVWRAVFMLVWMLASGVVAYLTFRARSQDAIIYTPFCIKGALMCATYLICAIAFLRRRPGVARAVFALSSLLVILGVGTYSIASMYILISAYAGKYLILGLIGVWALECIPLYLRLIGLSLSAHKIAKAK